MSAKVRGGRSENRRHGGQAARGTCKRAGRGGAQRAVPGRPRPVRPPSLPPSRTGPYLRQRQRRGGARRYPQTAGAEGAERGGPRGGRGRPGEEPADAGREDTGRHGDLFPAGTAPLPPARARRGEGRGHHRRGTAAAATAPPGGRRPRRAVQRAERPPPPPSAFPARPGTARQQARSRSKANRFNGVAAHTRAPGRALPGSVPSARTAR